MNRERATVTAAALLYALVVGAFVIYVAALDSDDSFSTAALVALGVVQLLVGLALGWRSLALLPLLPLLAIPVPVPEDAYEPLPLWFFMLAYVGPIALVLMVVGALGREAIDRSRLRKGER